MQMVANQYAVFQTDVGISICHGDDVMFLIRINMQHTVTKYILK